MPVDVGRDTWHTNEHSVLISNDFWLHADPEGPEELEGWHKGIGQKYVLSS